MAERRLVASARVVVRPPGYRRPVPLRLWYPSWDARPGAPVAADLVPLPAMVFAHGYLASAAAYGRLLVRLASGGLVVAAPETARGGLPDHRRFAEDLLAVAGWLRSPCQEERWLDGVVDPARIGLVGHSMGGGCALLAAGLAAGGDPPLASVCVLAAALTRSHPTAVEAAARVTVPVQLVAGDLDWVAPLERHQRLLYDALPAATPAQLVVLRGVRHSDPLRDAPHLRAVLAVVEPWLRLTLCADATAVTAVWGEPDPSVVAWRDQRGDALDRIPPGG